MEERGALSVSFPSLWDSSPLSIRVDLQELFPRDRVIRTVRKLFNALGCSRVAPTPFIIPGQKPHDVIMNMATREGPSQVKMPFVPKNILTAIDPAIANLKPSLKQKDDEYGINLDPSGSRVLRKDGVIVSNSLAAFAYIRAHPERAALLFVSSVCIGLALTLCALVVRGSCTKDFRELQLAREHLVPGSDKGEQDSENEAGEEDSSSSDFPGELSGFCRTSYPIYSSIEAAELAERIERREQIIQEIWMNSGLDTSLPRNMGQFY